MVDDGRITRPSQGLWEITEKGLEWHKASTWLVSSIVDDDPIDNDI
jgi:hypothetical protein